MWPFWDVTQQVAFILISESLTLSLMSSHLTQAPLSPPRPGSQPYRDYLHHTHTHTHTHIQTPSVPASPYLSHQVLACREPSWRDCSRSGWRTSPLSGLAYRLASAHWPECHQPWPSRAGPPSSVPRPQLQNRGIGAASVGPSSPDNIARLHRLVDLGAGAMLPAGFPEEQEQLRGGSAPAPSLVVSPLRSVSVPRCLPPSSRCASHHLWACVLH